MQRRLHGLLVRLVARQPLAGGRRRGVETNHLLVVAASGGKSVKVAPASRATNYFVVGWMPDGKSLVYERSSGTLGHAGCCRLDLRVAATDGGHLRVAYRFPDPFYKGSSPSLSPDGRAIAYMTPSSDGRSDLIRVVELRSGAVHAMDVGVVFDQAPAWSPTHASWRSHGPTARS